MDVRRTSLDEAGMDNHAVKWFAWSRIKELHHGRFRLTKTNTYLSAPKPLIEISYGKNLTLLEAIGLAVKCLSELKPGEKGRITRVGGGGSIRRRMLDMGTVAGTEVEVERVAPLGDPIEVKIKGFHMSLRREEAANIDVEVI